MFVISSEFFFFAFSQNYDRWTGRKTRLCRNTSFFSLTLLAFRLSKVSKLDFYTNAVLSQARFRRRSTHVPNLIDELSPAKERRLNQFGTAVLIRCGNVVKFDKVCRIIRHWSGN